MPRCHVPGGIVTWVRARGDPGGVKARPLCSGVLHVGVHPSSPKTSLVCRAWRAQKEMS